MAQQFKLWMEASSLIIAARKSPRSPPVSVKQKSFSKPSASSGQNSAKCNTYNLNNSEFESDYAFLTMKRSKKSSFFPNAVVFPGGVTDKHDFNPQWLKIFENSGIFPEQFKKLNSFAAALPTYENHQFSKEANVLPATVGFRINAIRETFEETGVLIAKSNFTENSDDLGSTHSSICDFSEKISPEQLKEWRKRVANDANDFINFCNEYKIYPDIWSLKEWSCWLTPVTSQAFHKYKLKKRYDTVFYILCTDIMPECSGDDSEVQSVEWYSADNVLKKFYSSEHVLGPPQVYEFSRLLHFPFFENLSQYVNDRCLKGLQRWLPVNYVLKDGTVCLLPGDDFYPENPHQELPDIASIGDTLSENRSKFKNLNRMEIKDMNNIHCYCNIDLIYDQVRPMVLNDKLN